MPRFEMNGKAYTTDGETLEVLQSVMPEYHRSGDASAVAAIMILGLETGRIHEERPIPKKICAICREQIARETFERGGILGAVVHQHNGYPAEGLGLSDFIRTMNELPTHKIVWYMKEVS